jgi:hypothetical protein
MTSLPSSSTFTGAAAIIRGNLRLGGYVSKNPANQFGIKSSLTFSPSLLSKWKEKFGQ